MFSTLKHSARRSLQSISRSNLAPRFYSTNYLNSFMDTGLSDEQKEMQQMAHDFAMNSFFPNAAKWDAEKIFPVDTMREAAALGFGGVFVSDEYGGSGLSRVDGSIIFEQLAMGDTSTTAYITIHNMCAWMVDRFGNEAQKQKYLPDLCSMEKFASYCLTESSAGSDAASLKTRAVKKGDKYILNGEKMFISGAGASEVYLIMARTGEEGARGISCFIVEKGFKGISFGKNEPKLGWNTQPTRTVILEDCEVPAENLLGEEGQGFKVAMMGLDGGRLSIGTCSLGAAQQCFNLARDYTKQRKQFGRPIATFQNTEFKLADMSTSLETSRLLLRAAAHALDTNAPDKTMKCAMAKKYATERGFEVCNDALQLYGGYGYLREYPIERYLRDVRVHMILEGTNQIQQLIMARELLKD